MGKGRNKSHADQRADMRGGGWIGLPKTVWESAAYRAASPDAKVLLVEMLARFNGYNNGDINLDTRSATEALGRKNQAATGRAFAELMQLGLIDLAERSVWRERHARRWRLTFVSTGKPPNVRQATNDYLRWSEEDRAPIAKPKRKYDATRGVAETSSSATRCVAEPLPACDAVCSSNNGNEPFSPAVSATRGVEVISMPYGGGSNEPLLAPETAAGVSDNRVRPQDLAALRAIVLGHVEAAGVGAQSRLAEASNMQGGTLSRFLSGKAGLSRTHFINLQLALQNQPVRKAA